MSDLVERLRQWEYARGSTSDILLDEVAEAANEIEALRQLVRLNLRRESGTAGDWTDYVAPRAEREDDV